MEKAELLDSRYHAQNDVDEVVMMRNLFLNHPKILEAVEKLDLPKGSILVADTWPYGRDGTDQSNRKVQCYTYARNPSARGHEGSTTP